jgi:hypothetical protein
MQLKKERQQQQQLRLVAAYLPSLTDSHACRLRSEQRISLAF